MRANALDSDDLLGLAAQGDQEAVGQLLGRHRDRLRRMVAMRLDERVQQRVDPSDVVQEALTDASQQLREYLQSRPLPFYPWLRQIAWKRLQRVHEAHVGASKRSVAREQRATFGLTDASFAALAERLASAEPTASNAIVKREQRAIVRAALESLPAGDHEVLAMWYLEGLEVEEIAAVLGLTAAGVKSRHFRALGRLAKVLARNRRED